MGDKSPKNKEKRKKKETANQEKKKPVTANPSTKA